MSASFEVEVTPEEAALIEKAAAALGCGVEEFARSEVVLAARRELGDRTRFVLDGEALERWEEINRRPARDLPGVRRLVGRRPVFG